LPWWIYSLPANNLSLSDIQAISFNGDYPTSFGAFPYVVDRVISAFFGILTVVLMYVIARLLNFRRIEAALPAILASMDGALIILSRTMMTDSLLLGFGFFGLASLMVSDRFSERRQSFYLWLVFSGVLFGLTALVKWNGLAFMAIGFVYLWIPKKKFKEMVLVGVIALATYFFGMLFYLNSFSAGPVDTEASLWKTGPSTELVFPGAGDWLGNSRFVFEYTKATWQLHNSNEVQAISHGVSPIFWPLAFLPQSIAKTDGLMWFTPPQEVKKGMPRAEIVLTRNKVSWTLAFISLVAVLAAVIRQIMKNRPIAKDSRFLILSFGICYVPWFFIHYLATTPTSVLHFVPALLFSFMMLPIVLRRFSKNVIPIYSTIVFLTFLGLCFQAGLVYGW
jgi:dolichyl-phosphate-mannose--protein O-mannosyl transferase